jgi:tetratricopeptide (TPR) repeat protein/V8-like Glu-specific endopeptidase
VKDFIKSFFILLSLCFYFSGCAGSGISIEELMDTHMEAIPAPIIDASLGEVSLRYTPQDEFEGEKIRKAFQLSLNKSNIFSPNATHRVNVYIDELYITHDKIAVTFEAEAKGSYSAYTENDLIYDAKVISKGRSDWNEHFVGAVRQERSVQRALAHNLIEFIKRFRLHVKNNSQAVAQLFQDYQEEFTDSQKGSNYSNTYPPNPLTTVERQRQAEKESISQSPKGQTIQYALEQVQKYPDNAKSHLNLGQTYKELGRDIEAIVAFKESIRINPNFSKAHYLLGLVYEKNKRFKESLSSFIRVADIDSGYPNINYILGSSYSNLYFFKEAAASFEKAILVNPDNAELHFNLGKTYESLKQYEKAFYSFKAAVRLNSKNPEAYFQLGVKYFDLSQYEDAILLLKKAALLMPNDARPYIFLGKVHDKLENWDEAIVSYKKALGINPRHYFAHVNLGVSYMRLEAWDSAVKQFKGAINLLPLFPEAHGFIGLAYDGINDGKNAIIHMMKAEQIYKIKNNFMMVQKSRKNLRKFYARYGYNSDDFKQNQITTIPSFKIKETPSISQSQDIASAPKEQAPQSGSGSGFFVSKMGHVITNAHVVQNCNKVTISDNANKQVSAEIVNADKSNDLALLKLSTLEMASAESKSLIQKLGIVAVPLASKGLLRSKDVRLGEKVLVAGYPFGDTFSNTIKVTTGVVSATRGAGDNSGQFQLDAAVQPGNSGGPIYDSGGNIVGVVVAQLNKRTFGSFVENMNFGIKASTVRQFLVASGINSKKSERTEEKSTEQLAEIAKNQALMVMCLQ